MKYADNTTAIGHITNSDKSSYQEEINNLAECCTESNLLLNVSKTKELTVDSGPLEIAQNITGLHLPSISDTGEASE